MIDKILEKAREIDNPYTGKKIEVKKYLNKINYYDKDNKVIIEINRFGEDEAKNREIQRALIRILKLDLKIKGVKVIYKSSKKNIENMFPQAKIIAIISGKGGVGKSQITYSLAQKLTKLGKKVGIVDSDIYGYSIQKISDKYAEIEEIGDNVKPLISNEGIEMISTQHFIDDNKNEAVIWRGPLLSKMMTNFFRYTEFSKNLDYLLIDTPPGTGDVLLNLPTYFEKINALLITTPSENAAHVAVRAGKVAKQLNLNLLGIIENMSYFEIDNKKHYIFGQDGGNYISKELNIPILEKIPIKKEEINDYFDETIKKIIEQGV